MEISIGSMNLKVIIILQCILIGILSDILLFLGNVFKFIDITYAILCIMFFGTVYEVKNRIFYVWQVVVFFVATRRFLISVLPPPQLWNEYSDEVLLCVKPSHEDLSILEPVKNVVPQRTVLGPVHLLIYINSIGDVVGDCDTFTYEDDTIYSFNVHSWVDEKKKSEKA